MSNIIEKEEIILDIKRQYGNIKDNIGFIYYPINKIVCRKPIDKSSDSLEHVYSLFNVDPKNDRLLKIIISFDLDSKIPLFPRDIRLKDE